MEVDPLKAAGALPSVIDANEAVSKRLAQVSDLVDVSFAAAHNLGR